jgi:hypothetical protein
MGESIGVVPGGKGTTVLRPPVSGETGRNKPPTVVRPPVRTPSTPPPAEATAQATPTNKNTTAQTRQAAGQAPSTPAGQEAAAAQQQKPAAQPEAALDPRQINQEAVQKMLQRYNKGTIPGTAQEAFDAFMSADPANPQTDTIREQVLNTLFGGNPKLRDELKAQNKRLTEAQLLELFMQLYGETAKPKDKVEADAEDEEGDDAVAALEVKATEAAATAAGAVVAAADDARSKGLIADYFAGNSMGRELLAAIGGSSAQALVAAEMTRLRTLVQTGKMSQNRAEEEAFHLKLFGERMVGQSNENIGKLIQKMKELPEGNPFRLLGHDVDIALQRQTIASHTKQMAELKARDEELEGADQTAEVAKERKAIERSLKEHQNQLDALTPQLQLAEAERAKLVKGVEPPPENQVSAMARELLKKGDTPLTAAQEKSLAENPIGIMADVLTPALQREGDGGKEARRDLLATLDAATKADGTPLLPKGKAKEIVQAMKDISEQIPGKDKPEAPMYLRLMALQSAFAYIFGIIGKKLQEEGQSGGGLTM